MGNLVIVAIPTEDDYVNKISSEKIAHMTLLFLGESSQVKNFNQILDFVKHAADQSLRRFGLEVDRRGVLGPDQADVVFFSKAKWGGYESVRDFRSFLLKDDNIRAAFDSAEQFPEWIPHLTLGHPDAPAHPDERDFPGVRFVDFDRIAVWFGDFEGVEFPLKTHDWNDMGWDMAVPMSDVSKETVKNLLSHHGVKGQKWGVRRAGRSFTKTFIVDKARLRSNIEGVRQRRSSSVTVVDKKKRIKTRGGKGLPAHPDAVRARTLGQVGKGSGLKALSDKELQDYTKRLQLEASVKRLQYNEKPAAKRFVSTILGQSGKNSAQAASDSVVSGQVKKRFGKTLVKLGAAAAVG